MNTRRRKKTERTEEVHPAPPRTPLRFIVHVSRPHARFAYGAILAVTLAQLFSSLNPYIFKELVDGFTRHTSAAAQAELLLVWGSAYVLLTFVSYICWRTSGFVGIEWLTRVTFTGYERLYTYISNHSNQFFTDRFAGSIANKISNASDGAERMLERSLWGWYPELISTIAGLGLMLTVDIYIAVGFLVTLLLMFVVNYVLMQYRRPYVVAYAEASSKLTGDGVDFLTNMTAVRQYARRGFEVARITASADVRRIKDLRQWRLSEWAIVLNNVVAIFAVAAIFTYTYILFTTERASAGDVVLILAVVTRLTVVITFLGNMMNGFIRVYGEIEEGLKSVLVPYDILDAKRARPLKVSEGEITWRDVDFAFAENGVFRDFNLTITPGQRVGLVGQSGAGKTTFVSLLLRQHELAGGSILIDGQNIAEVTQDSLRESIAIVPQESALFHRTIRENIAYGDPHATEEEIINVAKMAQAHDFIISLPQGYDTLVGERGVKLSGGQRQRIAIARAMLKDAPILVLDEATSALDSESEVAIQKALHALMEGKTVIAIAHRLSTLREMDRIIVLEHGSIVEDGSHDALLQFDGVYASLWKHQAGGFLKG